MDHSQRSPIVILKAHVLILYHDVFDGKDEHVGALNKEDFLFVWIRGIAWGVESEPGEAVVVLN